jgi:hypothetical protein
MDDEPHEQRSHSVLWVVVALLLVYPLSIGAAFMLCIRVDPNQDSWPSTAFSLFYQPVMWATSVVGAGQMVVDYVEWFGP